MLSCVRKTATIWVYFLNAVWHLTFLILKHVMLCGIQNWNLFHLSSILANLADIWKKESISAQKY